MSIDGPKALAVEQLGRRVHEAVAQEFEVLVLHREARRRPVAAVPNQQVLLLANRGDDIERRDAARAGAALGLGAMKHDRRPVAPVREPRRHEPDDPGVDAARWRPLRVDRLPSPQQLLGDGHASSVCAWRCRLSRSSCSASCPRHTSPRASIRSSAMFACARRPAAFMRGPIAKPSVSALNRSGGVPATRASASRPGRSPCRIRARPSVTIRRFSSKSGATSTTVPSATRSMNSLSSSARPSASYSTWRKRYATPTAASSSNGYGESSRFGFTAATAARQLVRHRVVVEDDHVEPEFIGVRDFRHRADPAVRGHQQRPPRRSRSFVTAPKFSP